METREATVQELEAEQQEIGGEIEAAALREDVIEHSRLLMRRDQLPGLVRGARARPIRREIARLEREEQDVAAEEERVREHPPELPEAEKKRGVNAAMYAQQSLGSVVERRSAVGRELRTKRAELDEIVSEGPVPG